MTTYSVAEAKNTLPRLLDKAMAGERVVITRHGKPIAEIRPVDAARPLPTPDEKRAAFARLKAMRNALPPAAMSSVELLNAVYEEKPW
ncbi:MAG: type II toxin-antitoxin system Phd/YefM family antitoxin [Brevundimonas sp.]|uniref:type II toxin-antitoxin system Phd/YefM family antitoxin n=1 Tax=Brevundimonas sp. TaxID=1871086 RepID=UPI00391CDE14